MLKQQLSNNKKKINCYSKRMFEPILKIVGDASIRVNNAMCTEYGTLSFIVLGAVVLIALLSGGVIGGLIGSVSEQYNNLCDIARERKGAVSVTEQNRCNGTTDGRLMSTDWACRNDGYSGYNVAAVGE